ncbi:MAG TPA: hypothetical protein VFS43_16320 [Polyangiaceae bacterium]|nr:hypothetical protein [Polyangiaceae bacterium]
MLTRRTILSAPARLAPVVTTAKPPPCSTEGAKADRPAAPSPAKAAPGGRASRRKAAAERPASPASEGSDGGPPSEPPSEGGADEGAWPSVSRQTLEQTPGRVHQFLRGVGTSASIRAQLTARGYSKKVHAQGWRLLQATSGFFDDGATDGEADDTAVRAAIAEIDAWDEPGFRIINASLRARHPAQHAFLTQGLRASTGAESVTGVAALLDRLDALERAPEREATRKADHAALATLADRGIDARERKRLRALVERAQDFAERFDNPSERAKVEKRMREALLELRLWYEEWSEMARVTFKRRDELIRLGLASRRPRRGASSPGEGEGEPDVEPEGAAV